jgi:ABC-type antimicrobial peptide transport system permease subunit
MQPVTKLLTVFFGTVAIFTFAMAGMALAWPDVSLVRQLGCFDSYGPVETFLLLPIQSHPLAFAIGSGSIVAAVLLAASFAAWQDYQARPKSPA